MTSSQVSAMPPPQSASPFWQLMAMLAEEPALAWLGWVLRQREGVAGEAGAEAAARPAEAPRARSRSRPGLRATFLAGEAAAEEEAPPAGAAAREPHDGVAYDCPSCRRQASRHLGPRPLEALRLLEHSVHPRIWKTYKTGLSRFLAFREEAGLPATWPIPRDQIQGFLVHSQHRSSPKIFGYLSGISYISRLFRFPEPLQDLDVSRMVITLNMRGDIQRRGWTPLSQPMLRSLVAVMDSVCATFYNRILFRAAFVLSWFAALRPEEVVAEDSSSLQPSLLQLSDFEFSEDTVELQLRVLGVGPETFVFPLTRAQQPWLCPVLALSNYMAARPRREGPFFIHSNGEPLTKAQFLAILHCTVRQLGLVPEQFSLHSFWLGAIITAVKHRLPEDLIMHLARWPNRGSLPQ